jgi:hypothetical protein
MAITKDVTLDSTGAAASFHVTRSVTMDRISKTTGGLIASYVSEDAYKAGKMPLGQLLPVYVEGLPAVGQDAFAFFETSLMTAADAQGSLALPYLANRNLFVGGVAQADT